jgi:beta-glucosidase
VADTSVFPAGFVWGAATSAYQIEGSPLADGAGPSNWHRFSHIAGRIRNGDTGDVACDHYRRWREDIALMRELGLDAYRFSIAWSRILPEGMGRANARGVAFYDQLVDALLEAGIEPFVTLYHWDLPLAIEDRGGWLERDSAEWFADYARVVFAALGDRVMRWATLNEPWVVMDAGYAHGVHPPGHRSWAEVPLVSHNLLRGHGLAVRAYRAERGDGEIGIVVNLEPKYPYAEREEDVTATARADAYINRHYLDPLFTGAYPDELREMFGDAWPEFPDEDFRLITEPIDYLGINYYKRSVTRADPDAVPTGAREVPQAGVHTELGWEVYPDGLTDTLAWVHARYRRLPLYVTENGAAFADPAVVHSSLVDDPARVAYVRDHLAAVARARASGVDVRGYFVWSLLDNFEWAEGYSKRFGLYHVNFATQRRTPKASAHFYADVIRSNGAALAEVLDEAQRT